MISMNMYRSRRATTTKPILASTAVATNRSVDSDEFERFQSTIPEDSSHSLQHSEQECLATGDSTNTKERVAKSLLEQQYRQAAMARLEEFFLGEVATNLDENTASSPVSVLDISRSCSQEVANPESSLRKITESKIPPSSPARNIFGDIIEQPNEPGRRIPAMAFIEEPDMHLLSDTGLFLEEFLEEDDENGTWQHSDKDRVPSTQTFVKLSPNNRANSLPIECMTTSNDGQFSPSPRTSMPSLTKRSSLKKISSIGQNMSSHKSDGNLLQRTVSFSSLSIREYPPALSDNPSCSFGPPIQLDWDHEAEATHQIDHYEEARKPRRDPHDLLLSYYDRRFLLRHAGCSKSEVKNAMKEIERVKRERMVTDLFLPAQAFDETMERVVDTVKDLFRVREREDLPKTKY